MRFGHALWKDIREIEMEEGLIQASEPGAQASDLLLTPGHCPDSLPACKQPSQEAL